MTDVVDRARAAHREAVSMGVADVAGYLQDALGQTLVAYLAGMKDQKTVSNWARGDHTPRAEAEKRMRLTYQVLHMIQAEESLHTARAWFVGLNPQLADESPATAVREGRLQDVLTAARAFMSGG